MHPSPPDGVPRHQRAVVEFPRLDDEPRASPDLLGHISDGIRPGSSLVASPRRSAPPSAVALMTRTLLRGLLLGAGLVAAVATAAYLYLVAEISVAYSESPPQTDRDLAG